MTAADAQRRIRRSPLLFTAPLVLVSVFVAMLVWEVVRSNVSRETQQDWPWQLELLDTQTLGSLIAVGAGVGFARAQYARTARPMLGWRAGWLTGEFAPDVRAWDVGVFNSGQHNAVIEEVAYQVKYRERDSSPRPGVPWTDYIGLVDALDEAGLKLARDYRCEILGAGFPMIGSGSYETVRAGAFTERFVREVDAVYMRVRVTDAVGDSHERVMNLLKGAMLELESS
ncbi:hypothetical protein J7I98_20780 [Streptomyces sp. ISL-98]|nr:hypothetical protein [Streptomyces sp. ISL-98]